MFAFRCIGVLAVLSGAAFLHSAEPADAIKFPDERAAWQAIAARFEGQPVLESKGKDSTIRVEKLKGQTKGAATASVQVNADGHVTNVTSNSAGFTNDEFKFFAAFPELASLTLWHNGKIDAKTKTSPSDGSGLNHLMGLKKLAKITLAGGALGDPGLAAAAKLPAITELHIWHSSFTDAGIAEFRNHPGLEVVRMGPMWTDQSTDKSLEALGTCPKLRSLQIGETYLTWEGGLQHLAKLPALKSLDLRNSLIEPADVEKLKTAMPKTMIAWEGLAGAGTVLSEKYSRGKAEKWMPKDLIARAVAEAAKK